jgi:acetylornithine deacetylase/succinyl-diaminopimelate desuccinylase-like protein
MNDLSDYFSRQWNQILEDWKTLVRFPSISAELAHEADCRACADWLKAFLEDMGLPAEIFETSGKPLVFAEHAGVPGSPTVLLYGHYDVQPVDPLDQWTHPPFEPVFENGRLYGRGAQDDKGQFLYALESVKAILESGGGLPHLKIILEGEEESGSRGLTEALPALRDKLKADILMVQDTGMAPSGAPALTMGLRGIIHLTCKLSGPKMDLHSGQHGGKAPNPATQMARLIATLHDSEGKIAVKGFYHGVPEPTELERSLANAEPFDANIYVESTGVPPVGGETGFTPPERAGFRPAIDINGIHSGYGGPGTKTIIPAEAVAKLSARLVAEQDPEDCLTALIQHLKEHAPEGLKLDIPEKGIGGPGVRLDPASPLAVRAAEVLRETAGKEPVFLWEGASIPVVAELAKTTGSEPLMVGFGLDEDRIHAPNESFAKDRFRQGFLYVAGMLRRQSCIRLKGTPFPQPAQTSASYFQRR